MEKTTEVRVRALLSSRPSPEPTVAMAAEDTLHGPYLPLVLEILVENDNIISHIEKSTSKFILAAQNWANKHTFALLEGTSNTAVQASAVRLILCTSSTTASEMLRFRKAQTRPGFWISWLLWNIRVVKSSWEVNSDLACRDCRAVSPRAPQCSPAKLAADKSLEWSKQT